MNCSQPKISITVSACKQSVWKGMQVFPYCWSVNKWWLPVHPIPTLRSQLTHNEFLSYILYFHSSI